MTVPPEPETYSEGMVSDSTGETSHNSGAVISSVAHAVENVTDWPSLPTLVTANSSQDHLFQGPTPINTPRGSLSEFILRGEATGQSGSPPSPIPLHWQQSAGPSASFLTSPVGNTNSTLSYAELLQSHATVTSNDFIINHLKIKEYVKNLEDTLSNIDSEASLLIPETTVEVEAQGVLEDSNTSLGTVQQDLADKTNITEDFLKNIDNIDFLKIGNFIKEKLQEKRLIIEALQKDYKKQLGLLKLLDSYNNNFLMELTSINIETTKEFSDILSKHISNIINKDVVRDSQVKLKKEINEFFEMYYKYKFIKEIDDTVGICSLCYERPVNITFIDCHHCCCSHCHNLFQLQNKCPMCRSEITSYHKIYI